jgi:hypothetical protein
VPSSRAVIGGVLVVAAAAGVLATHRSAGSSSREPVLVAVDAIEAGTVLGPEHLGTVHMEVPEGVAVFTEDEVDDVLGRSTGRALDGLDLLRPSDLLGRDRLNRPGSVEVALDLPPAQALAGTLRTGDRVDVLATDPEAAGTSTIVRGAVATWVAPADAGSIGASGTAGVRLAVADHATAEALVDASLRGEVTLTLPAPRSGGGDR